VVRVGNTLQTRCIACWDLNCRSCLNGTSPSCVNCSSGILKAGECVTANKCDLTIYYIVDNTTCLSCDPSCYGCYGTSSQSCKLCRPGYYNYSGNCTNECPLGTLVRTDKTCGCLG
jgi:proprotein convertase subtilisin/kexin type 5